MRSIAPAIVLGLALAGTACSEPAGTAVPVYAPSDTVLTEAPWPTDDRRTEAGTLDLTGFPNPDEIPLLEEYVATAEALPGWGPTAPIYVPFETLPDASLLPLPTESIDPNLGLALVDIDPDSPTYAQPIPVVWERIERGVLTPERVLAVAPLPGFTMRPGLHALVVTTQIAAPSEAFLTRLEEDPALAPLDEALPDLGLSRRDVAVGTVFTVRDPLAELDVLVDHVRSLPPATLSQEVAPKESFIAFDVWDATVDAPLWQHGNKPYAFEGGGFRFEEDGTPIASETETLRLALSTPKDLSDPPPGGWPLVIYAHGTGGAYDTFANGNGGLEPARLFADAGMVGLGFDQPLHGPRGTDNTDVDMHSFNYLNLESARANFRQGALDIVWLVHALRAGDVVFTTPEGDAIPIDSETILYQGHSHGGLTGALAAPWLGGELRGAMLSGAGGGLAITVVKRKDPLDIADLVGDLIRLGDEERLTPLHPVVGMVQLLAEETDPINYGPYFHAVDGGYSDTPLPVLLSSGQFDLQTDHETAEALAASAGLPLIAPAWNETDALRLRGLSVTAAPASNTTTAWDGAPITAGFSQWEDGDHFVIFDDLNAGTMVQTFLRTAADGDPVIDTSP